MRVVQLRESRLRDCQSTISAPSSSPALLPKSLATTAGPKSLMLASGLLAISMPTYIDCTKRRAVSVVHSVTFAGASFASCTTNSASIAANPRANTGASKVASSEACCTELLKIGPTSRCAPYFWLRGSGIQPTFQPAIESLQSAMASSWHRYAESRSAGTAPGYWVNAPAVRRAFTNSAATPLASNARSETTETNL